jgi:hypothetical protein
LRGGEEKTTLSALRYKKSSVALARQSSATPLDSTPFLLFLAQKKFPARQLGRIRVAGGAMCQIALVSIVATQLADTAPNPLQRALQDV